MFTGIVEELGEVTELQKDNGNLFLTVTSNISENLKIDQSISHNGACLTVIETSNGKHKVCIIEESLRKTNLGGMKVGDVVNLERATTNQALLDGHIVQGHVDTTGEVSNIVEEEGSVILTVKHKVDKQFMTVEKGSICMNGISLTVLNSEIDQFSVAIIPYTWEHTNISKLKIGSLVNLEFDIIGKYLVKYLSNLDRYKNI